MDTSSAGDLPESAFTTPAAGDDSASVGERVDRAIGLIRKAEQLRREVNEYIALRKRHNVPPSGGRLTLFRWERSALRSQIERLLNPLAKLADGLGLDTSPVDAYLLDDDSALVAGVIQVLLQTAAAKDGEPVKLEAAGNAKQDGPAKRSPKLWLAEAMLVVRDNPEWRDRKIAAKVGRSPSTRSDETMKPGQDFMTFQWGDETFEFQRPMQRAAIKHLWAAWENGHPKIPVERLREMVGSSEHAKPFDWFRGNPAWNRLVVSPSKGVYVLKVPDMPT